MFRKVLLPVVAAGSLLASASQVYALQEGDFAIKAGASYIKPDDIKIKGTQYKLKGEEEWTIDFGALFMASDNIGIEIGTVWPTKFTSKFVSGSAKAEYEMMPITATAQFYFMDSNEPMRPYVGLGTAFTRYSSEKLKNLGNNKLSIDDNWGWTFQAGAVFDLDEQIFIDASVRYIDMEMEGKLDGVKFKKADLDPWIYSINAGIKF